MDYRKINNYLGWLVFIIATTVYFMTLEDTVSLWDCGEYVTAAYKLEVGHPPGAPLFMVLGRLSSFFAEPENVAIWINRLSALSSSATILFMFWSLTLLVKKIILRTKESLDLGDKIAIFGSALVGSLAYTFSESFWFSAVEGEVYAMASLFTAIIFWAALRWDDEMIKIQKGALAPVGYSPDRWMLLIMFMLGLAIGVHLLGILVVPAIAYVIYFRYNGISRRFFNVYIGIAITSAVVGVFRMGNTGGDVFSAIFMNALILGVLYALFLWSRTQKVVEFLLVGLMSVIILSFIQEGVITGSVSFAAFLEIGLVTGFGMPFFSGTILFFVILIGLFIYLLRRSRNKGNRVFFSSVMGLLLLLIGYGSFAVIVIRSNANTPLDENDPENLVTLHSYLKRDQYGHAPLSSGPYFNSKESGGTWVERGDGQMRWSAQDDRADWDDQSPVHVRRFVVSKNDQIIKAFENEKKARAFVASESGTSMEETYFETNDEDRKRSIPTYSQNTFFPRMYWSAEPVRTDSYKEWSGYDANDELAERYLQEAQDMGISYVEHPKVGKDGQRLPTFGENLNFFYRYQVNWMYVRYFMWNFSGRQNDIQGSRGSSMRGNWTSGFSAVDDARLGSQADAPYFTTQNKSNNYFFFLPLIFGLIGMFFHFYRAPKDAFVLLLAFIFTGLAIVVYLNQKTLEPRERDYAYAGSFYFFAMWIGLGVYGLYESFKSFSNEGWKRLGFAAGGGLLLFFIIDMNAPVSYPSVIAWLIVCAIGGALIGIMYALRKMLKNGAPAALLATLVALIAPMIMAVQGWDDHDRSLKTSAHDLAYNYLSSCGENGIIFTNGDNDTFPLWYLQEVEGQFTDVRVCNLSLMQTDWYTNQMKMKAYKSEPLPIKFTEDQILMNHGGTDQVLFSGILDLLYNGADKKIVEKMVALRVKANRKAAKAAVERIMIGIPQVLSGAKANSTALDNQLQKYAKIIERPIGKDLAKAAYEKIYVGYKILEAVNGRSVTIDQEKYKILQEAVIRFEDGWDITDLRDAMKFVRDDANMIGFGDKNQMLRVFPSSGFVMPVNKTNLLASGMVTKAQLKDCADEIRFRFKYDSEKDRISPSRAAQLTKGGLTREQVMMMDIIANNDWKRPLSFSSPSGSEVSTALLSGYSGQYTDGHLKQNGLAFELTPLGGRSASINRDRMYDNLMNKYHYGQMNNPKVLTDYYTRRHTSQYRSHFLRLAREYAMDAANAEKYYEQENANPNVKGLPSKAEIVIYKKKAIALLKKSLKVMPAHIVIDTGEPNHSGGSYQLGGQQIQAYSDGVLQDYVEVFYLAGDKKSANQLANTLCDQMESVFNYFDKSDVRIVGNQHALKDMFAAMDAYFVMYDAIMNPSGEPNSALAKRMEKKLNELYSSVIKSMLSSLKEAAEDHGETMSEGSKNAGLYASQYYNLQSHTLAMAVHYGMMEDPSLQQAPVQQAPPSPEQALPQPGQVPQ